LISQKIFDEAVTGGFGIILDEWEEGIDGESQAGSDEFGGDAIGMGRNSDSKGRGAGGRFCRARCD